MALDLFKNFSRNSFQKAVDFVLGMLPLQYQLWALISPFVLPLPEPKLTHFESKFVRKLVLCL